MAGSQLKQRRLESTPSVASKVENTYPLKKNDNSVHNNRSSAEAANRFFQLSTFQILIGVTYASVLYAILHMDSLQSYREYTSWFLTIQHRTSWGMAHVGSRDIYYVMTAFVAIITMRAALQLLIYAILFVRKDLDVKARIRFTEQAWCIAYYGGAAIWGMTLLQSQPYGWNAGTLWVDFPHYYIDPAVKKYYLSLLSYWFTQMFIIHIEDRRKDHYQMLSHHIVTCALVVGSYVWSYTRIGHLVLIMMDTVDVFLSLAKCSKYLRVPSWITDGIFVIFLISWVLLRHFMFMYEMTYAAFPALDDLEGRCVFDFENASLYAAPIQCFSKKVHYTFFILAMALQAITVMWLVMIVRIVLRVIHGDGAADTRSDSEDD